MKSFTYLSLGCKVNNYESSALSTSLISKGYVLDEVNPDVVFINTCSVTATADQKSRQHIRKLMNMYPRAITVVMGCYAQKNHEYIFNELKPSIVTGTSNRDQLVELIAKYELDHIRMAVTKDKSRLFSYEELGITSYQENVRAYLKIEDGCDNFCSYCLIPYVRGKARSRNKDDITKEAKDLISKGYKEIVLTGINVSFYGKDLGNTSFYKLVKELLDLEGLYRLRISSIEASDISTELINLYSNPKLAAHMHIPLQSGSDTVLKRMNRKYTSKELMDKISLIHQVNPNIAITTDVIVGFPGETDEEFNQTYNFIKSGGFAMLHVFPYSPREGTKAYSLPNQVDPKVKKERCNKLLDLSDELCDIYTSKYVNQEVEVLVEQYDKNNKYNIGHTSNYLEVKIPGLPIKVGTVVKTKFLINHKTSQ